MFESLGLIVYTFLERWEWYLNKGTAQGGAASCESAGHSHLVSLTNLTITLVAVETAAGKSTQRAVYGIGRMVDEPSIFHVCYR